MRRNSAFSKMRRWSKRLSFPAGPRLPRKETDAWADWAKGFGAKGLAVTKVAKGAFDTGIAKFINPVAARLIERTGANDGDLLAFAADKPKIVHKVLGELRLKLVRDLKLPASTDYAWVWIVDFPLFEYDDEEKRFASTHHPFTAPLDADLAKLDSRERAIVEGIKSKAYDIVVNGTELGGGSIRIHRMRRSAESLLPCWASTRRRRSKNSGFCLTACNTALRRTAASPWVWTALS